MPGVRKSSLESCRGLGSLSGLGVMEKVRAACLVQNTDLVHLGCLSHFQDGAATYGLGFECETAWRWEMSPSDMDYVSEGASGDEECAMIPRVECAG